MQSLKKIMQDMGFNPDAPLETQKAFIKHLIASAEQTKPRSEAPPTSTKVQTKTSTTQKKNLSQEPQMTFDASVLGTVAQESTPNKKRVS